jgi:CRISPR/Cas system-associated exonuclease Cas4 (RecB family)
MAEASGLIKISASSTKTYSQCKKKYWFQYINRSPRKEFQHLLLGNFCHKVLEVFHRSYMENKIPYDQLGTLMSNSFKEARKEFTLEKPVLEEAFGLVKDYLATIEETGMPDVVGVEIPFEFNLTEDIGIRGFIDRLDRVGGKYKLCDYKTTKNAKYLDPFQLSMYGLWLRKEHPEVTEFEASYILLRHKSKEKAYTLNTKDLDQTEKELINYANSIKTELEWPTAPGPLCKYCDFNELCPETNGW